MGCYRNTPPGEKDNDVTAVIAWAVLLLIFFGITVLASNVPDCYLKKVDNHYPDEIVKSITYGHSFLDGNYCTIVTNKDMYTISKDEDCFRNKPGKALIFGIWENVCEDSK